MNKRFIQNVILMVFTLTLLLPVLSITHGQEVNTPFYFGVDLSYVNEMEDCGAVYRENGETRDPFALFAEHGATLVRARLWHNPTWTDYSTLEDVMRTFRRARDAGMATLLDIQYSDTWADPAHQDIPAAWADLNDDELVDAVYQYTTDVFTELAAENLVPAFVQIGNETNSGILKRGSDQDWSRDATLFNAGIRAVRDFAAATGADTQILLHVAQPQNTDWWFTQAEAAGIADFDVIGISFYPQWSTFSISDMGAQVTHLRERFGKDVMVLETAYGWTRDEVAETASNILIQGVRGYPFSPEGQHRFLTDLVQSLISNGALGVVYWEPAWVSTGCSTRWGQGSHWENATFFDFQNNNEVLEGIDFPRGDYLYPASPVDGVIEATYGDPLIADEIGDALNDAHALDLDSLYLRADEDMISLALVVAGDVFSNRGSYLIYIDTTHDEQGASVDVARRPITVADPHKPEFRLDISIQQEGDFVRGSYILDAWLNDAWEEITFTGGATISAGETSIIELQIPRTLLGNPQLANIAIISTDRGRVHSASDILGTADVLTDSSAPLVLSEFYEFDLSD